MPYEHPFSGRCEGQETTAADTAILQSDSELYEEQDEQSQTTTSTRSAQASSSSTVMPAASLMT